MKREGRRRSVVYAVVRAISFFFRPTTTLRRDMIVAANLSSNSPFAAAWHSAVQLIVEATSPPGATPRHATHAFAMFAATSASSRVLAAPTTSKAAKAGGVRRVAARASASEDKRAAVPIATSRRAFTAAGLAAAVAALSPRAALAFGNGIPGYDINEKARDAQRKAIKDELGEQKELARLEKERRRAARAAEEAAAAAAEAAQNE